MQITEKLRKEIIVSLPKLPSKKAEEIAKACNVHRDTVYRQYRKLKSTDPIFENAVIMKLTELATFNKMELVKTHKRMKSLAKQLSDIK